MQNNDTVPNETQMPTLALSSHATSKLNIPSALSSSAPLGIEFASATSAFSVQAVLTNRGWRTSTWAGTVKSLQS